MVVGWCCVQVVARRGYKEAWVVLIVFFFYLVKLTVVIVVGIGVALEGEKMLEVSYRN